MKAIKLLNTAALEVAIVDEKTFLCEEDYCTIVRYSVSLECELEQAEDAEFEIVCVEYINEEWATVGEDGRYSELHPDSCGDDVIARFDGKKFALN